MSDSKENRTVGEILNEISIVIMDLEKNDLPAIARLHELFKILSELHSRDDWRPKINAAIEVVERLIMEEVSFDEAIKRVGYTVNELQDSYTKLESPERDLNRQKNGPQNIEVNEIVDENIIRQFLMRQPSLLDEFEKDILDMEKGDKETVIRIKRYLHTLKGEAGILEFNPLNDFIHEIESLIQSSEAEMRMPSTDGLLSLKDFLVNYFQSNEQKRCVNLDQTEAEKILKLFVQINADNGGVKQLELIDPESGDSVPNVSLKETYSSDITCDLSLVQDFVNESQEHLHNAEVTMINMEDNPGDKENLNAIFRIFHTIKGVAGFLGFQDILALSHQAEAMLDRARKGEIDLTAGHIDVIFDALDMLGIIMKNLQRYVGGESYKVADGLTELLERLRNPEIVGQKDLKGPAVSKKMGEILVETGKASSESIEVALKMQKDGSKKPLGEILVTEGEAKSRDVVTALRAQKSSQNNSETRSAKSETAIKVNTSRLDSLIDMVGELVIANSMVAQELNKLCTNGNRLAGNVAHLGKIVRELQELSMSLRMVSMRVTFQKMARLVRDLSRKNNKKVNFEMLGEDTELDRNIVEDIGDPLIHMVRNAVDHGLESSDERIAAQKPEYGMVKLTAFHRAGNVVIEIEDDGRGLDKDKILSKAVKMGIVKDGENLNEREIHNLIFHPGLSTAKEVTDISGRGVGMDVVKKNIESLRGHIDITSTPGRGTVISLILPLTLAIIDGTIISVGSEQFIVPTGSVIESFRPMPGQVSNILGKGELVSLRGNLIPLFHVDELFGISGASSNPYEAIVIVLSGTDDGKLRSFVVDSLVGQQQVVIKSLGSKLGKYEEISGGAILGDGRVRLIIDTSGLIRVAESMRN